MSALNRGELALLEEVLARHRGFGDSVYPHEQMRDAHETYLTSVADRMSAAGRMLTVLEGAGAEERFRVLGSTVVRCAIHHAHSQLHGEGSVCLPLERCSAILDAATDLLAAGPVGCLPLDAATTRSLRVGRRASDGAAWRMPTTDNILSSAFCELVRQNYGVPAGADRVDLVRVRTGVGVIVPQCRQRPESRSPGCRVPEQGPGRGIGSSSQFRLTGTIFLSRELLDDPWTVAEQILHESLHQKLYDFRFGHKMLRPGEAGSPPALVRSPWNAFDAKRTNLWDTF